MHVGTARSLSHFKGRNGESDGFGPFLAALLGWDGGWQTVLAMATTTDEAIAAIATDRATDRTEVATTGAVEPIADRPPRIDRGWLRRVHHIALNVQDLNASRRFYGELLGLEELTGDRVPSTLRQWVADGKVANFLLPDGLILDLFWEPELSPPDPDPDRQFTRANHLAFDTLPQHFDAICQCLQDQGMAIALGPVTRPTGRGVYFYDPDGFMIEIRCDPL